MIEVKLRVEEYNRSFMLYLDEYFDDIFAKYKTTVLYLWMIVRAIMQ